MGKWGMGGETNITENHFEYSRNNQTNIRSFPNEYSFEL